MQQSHQQTTEEILLQVRDDIVLSIKKNRKKTPKTKQKNLYTKLINLKKQWYKKTECSYR